LGKKFGHVARVSLETKFGSANMNPVKHVKRIAMIFQRSK